MATVAINNSTNAAPLFALIIGTNMRPTLEDMQVYAERLEEEVIAKKKLGYKVLDGRCT